ncbi:MAG: ferritin [bacterium]|nr:ferritin [bacterium]
MIKKKIEDAINQQIQEEMFSSNLYLSMVAYFEEQNLKGFSYWMKTQVQEEMFHTMKLFSFVLDRGGKPKVPALAEPKKEWTSVLNVFEEAMAHEEHITNCINNLMDLAIEEKDHAARGLLSWFVDEQVEEEANFNEIVDKLKMIGDDKPSLLLQDKEMTQRPQGLNPFFGVPAQ